MAKYIKNAARFFRAGYNNSRGICVPHRLLAQKVFENFVMTNLYRGVSQNKPNGEYVIMPDAYAKLPTFIFCKGGFFLGVLKYDIVY